MNVFHLNIERNQLICAIAIVLKDEQTNIHIDNFFHQTGS